MMDLAKFNGLGFYPGGEIAPIGSYWAPDKMCYIQSASDQTLPLVNTWIKVTTSGSSTASQIATAINTACGTSFTSANLHSYTSADLSTAPGTGANDA